MLSLAQLIGVQYVELGTDHILLSHLSWLNLHVSQVSLTLKSLLGA